MNDEKDIIPGRISQEGSSPPGALQPPPPVLIMTIDANGGLDGQARLTPHALRRLGAALVHVWAKVFPFLLGYGTASMTGH